MLHMKHHVLSCDIPAEVGKNDDKAQQAHQCPAETIFAGTDALRTRVTAQQQLKDPLVAIPSIQMAVMVVCSNGRPGPAGPEAAAAICSHD